MLFLTIQSGGRNTALNDEFEKRNPKIKAPSNKEQQEKLQALEDEVRELRKEKERDQSERGASDKVSINCTVQLNIPEVIIYIIMKLNQCILLAVL